MKKIFISVFILLIIFSFSFNANALMAICQYDNDDSTLVNNAPSGSTSGKNIYVFMNGSRRFLWLDNNAYKGREISSDIVTSFTYWYKPATNAIKLFVDTYEYLVSEDSTSYFFRYSYDNLFVSDYQNGSVQGTAIAVYFNGKNYSSANDPTFSADTKRKFVEDGTCPKYVCHCHGKGTNDDDMFLFFNNTTTEDQAKSICKDSYSVDLGKAIMNAFTYRGPKEIEVFDLQSCTLSYQRYNLVDMALNDKQTNSAVDSSALRKSLNNLTKEDLIYMNRLFSFSKVSDGNPLPLSSATEYEYSQVAKYLVARNPNIVVAGERILSNPDAFKDNSVQEIYDLYQDLYANVKTFMRLYYKGNSSALDLTHDETCDSVFGDYSDKDSFAHYLGTVLNFIQYVGPILVILLTIAEYFKVLFDKNGETIKKASSNTVKRVVLMLMLFFLPILVKFVLETFDIVGTCDITNWL